MAEPPEPTSRRRLGTPTLSALVVANMVGAGVFTTSGFALADLGTPGLVMAAWAVGGGLALMGALSYGALAARLAESGGEYLFLSRTIHPLAGFLAGWVSLWAGFTGAIAFAAEALQVYVAAWVPEGVPLDLVGSAAIVLAGAVHTVGLRSGAWLQNTAVAVKLALLAAFFVLAWSALPESTPPVAGAGFALGPFVVSLMWISLSYSGWNAAVYIGGEARDAERTLPRSLLLGTLVVTALYLGLNWVFVHSAPVEELAGQQDIAAVAAAALGGVRLESVVRGVIVVALFTSVSSMVMIGPRVYARMAEDGLFPRLFAFKGEVPSAAIWLQVALSVAVLWASGLRAQLSNLGWILSLFTAITVIGLIRLRLREGPERVPVPGWPWVPGLFALAVLVLTAIMAVVATAELLPAGVVLATGAVAYAWFGRAVR